MNVVQQMDQWGDGSIAIVRVRFSMGGGHVFIAERENGKVRFVDPQNGSTDASGYFERVYGSGIELMRVDDLEFSSLVHGCISPRK